MSAPVSPFPGSRTSLPSASSLPALAAPGHPLLAPITDRQAEILSARPEGQRRAVSTVPSGTTGVGDQEANAPLTPDTTAKLVAAALSALPLERQLDVPTTENTREAAQTIVKPGPATVAPQMAESAAMVDIWGGRQAPPAGSLQPWQLGNPPVDTPPPENRTLSSKWVFQHYLRTTNLNFQDA